MKKLNYFIFTGGLMSCCSASFADEKVMVAYCQPSHGCEAYLSDLTYTEANLLLDYLGTADKNIGSTLVIMENKSKQWTAYFDKKRNLKQLNEYFGGQGQSVIRLFPRILLNDIQPKDGFWSITSTHPKVTGCPHGVAEQLSKKKITESGSVKFSQPFKATDMIKHQSIKWLKAAPNQYKARLIQSDNTQAMLTSTYSIKIVSQDLIKGQAISNINISTARNCKIVMDFRYTRKAG